MILRSTRIRQSPAGFIPVIYSQANIITSRVTGSFNYDTRNASVDPTSGSRVFNCSWPWPDLGVTFVLTSRRLRTRSFSRCGARVRSVRKFLVSASSREQSVVLPLQPRSEMHSRWPSLMACRFSNASSSAMNLVFVVITFGPSARLRRWTRLLLRGTS